MVDIEQKTFTPFLESIKTPDISALKETIANSLPSLSNIKTPDISSLKETIAKSLPSLSKVKTPSVASVKTPSVLNMNSDLNSSIKSPSPELITSTAQNSSSWFSFWTLFKIFLIVLIMSILGFNIVTYLAKGTDFLADLAIKIGEYLPDGIARTLNLSGKGTKLAADVTAGTIIDVGNVLGGTTSAISKSIPIIRKDIKNKNLEKVVNTPSTKPKTIVKQDRSDSKVQSKNKESWCYVGKDRNFRSCVQLKDGAKCMSGEIFPNKTICINPNLRE
jgi:hypothetical protein